MSWGRPVQLTRADRAYRREKVVAAIAAGEARDAVAARLGLSLYSVRAIAAAAGFARRSGRPRAVDCAVQSRRYRNLRARIGAKAAREALGIAPLA